MSHVTKTTIDRKKRGTIRTENTFGEVPTVLPARFSLGENGSFQSASNPSRTWVAAWGPGSEVSAYAQWGDDASNPVGKLLECISNSTTTRQDKKPMSTHRQLLQWGPQTRIRISASGDIRRSFHFILYEADHTGGTAGSTRWFRRIGRLWCGGKGQCLNQV